MASKADVIVGVQWGDEGKGRIVDLYAAEYDVVARSAAATTPGIRSSSASASLRCESFPRA